MHKFVRRGVLSLAVLLVATATQAGDWAGAGLLNGGKGYADTPMGQVHYRDRGPRESKAVVVLLHQTPMSMIEFAQVQDALAAKGIRAITIDTPGYGLSDHPPGQPTIANFADNIVPVLDHLNIRRAIVGGHHTGASIAVSFAARHPDRVSGIILHGTPLFTKEEGAQWLARSSSSGIEPRPDGAHMTMSFRNASPEESAGDTLGRTWLTVTTFLQGKDIGHPAAFTYVMEPDLKALRVPGLILTDTRDVITDLDRRAAKMRPDFKLVELSDGTAYSLIGESQHWADVAGTWISQTKFP